MNSIELKQIINKLKDIGVTGILCDNEKLALILSEQIECRGLIDRYSEFSLLGIDIRDSSLYCFTERYSDE